MASGKLRLISPTAESWEPGPKVVTSRWEGDLHGKTVALVDDARPNADITVAAIGECLVQEYGVKTINVDLHPFQGEDLGAIEIPKEVVDRLRKEADAVIIALAS
ncbi:MAG: hypothetical protein HYX92_03445 [Chloroflexi bacterium]|nr:hypothetical protein [Chloroflexota bacterium]